MQHCTYSGNTSYQHISCLFLLTYRLCCSVGPGPSGKLVTSRKAVTINEDNIVTKADPGTSIQNNTDETNTSPAVTWTQNQQKLLEMALQQYPKTTPDRWTCIARCVPGMTKVKVAP